MKRKSRSADVEGLVTHATTEAPAVARIPSVVFDRDDARPDLPSERIDPAQLLGVALLLAIGISTPSLKKAIDGRVSLLTAAWYFGWAVIVSVLGIWLLWAVWHTYRAPIDEQRRRDWEQSRADRLAALEAENLERIQARRSGTENAPRAALSDTVERMPDASELPRSLRQAIDVVPDDVHRSVALSDPLAGSR
jgi:hypothetical protein